MSNLKYTIIDKISGEDLDGFYYDVNYKTKEVRHIYTAPPNNVYSFVGFDNWTFIITVGSTIICGNNCVISSGRDCEYSVGDNCRITLRDIERSVWISYGKNCEVYDNKTSTSYQITDAFIKYLKLINL